MAKKDDESLKCESFKKKTVIEPGFSQLMEQNTGVGHTVGGLPIKFTKLGVAPNIYIYMCSGIGNWLKIHIFIFDLLYRFF